MNRWSSGFAITALVLVAALAGCGTNEKKEPKMTPGEAFAQVESWSHQLMEAGRSGVRDQVG